MNKNNNRWALFVAFAAVALVMASRSALAGAVAPCPTRVALSVILGTTCTIEDKTFDFTTPISGTSSAFESAGVGDAAAPTPDELMFVTANDGGNPGFKLLAEPGSALSVTAVSTDAQDAMVFELLYSASITDPSSGELITGTTVTTTGATVNPTDPMDPSSVLASLAIGQLADSGLVCETNAAASGAVDLGDTPQPLPANTAPLPCGGVTDSLVALEVLIGGDSSGDNPNGTASITSVGTYVDESFPVPEPSTLMLGLTALLPIALRAVRRTGLGQV
jgi:hypothetical protein